MGTTTLQWTWIVSDPKICGGELCIKGTRVPIHLILDHIAAGDTFDDILKAYPQITKAGIQEALQYASLAVQEEIISVS
ncbi:MAG: DUF433 domain-containing protein [Elusimicrobia bacterium]|nr:DUF433 domain-containing protein [Elusimicrobiota bacterium]